MNESASLTLVIPAYNEAERIGRPFQQLITYLAKHHPTAEVIVVDDGSTDGTLDVLRPLIRDAVVRVRLLRCETNRGKGHALKVGFSEAVGDRIVFTDADLSTPIEETDRLLAELDRGSDIAIGSRKMEGANITVRQPWYRELMGKVFTNLVRVFIADVSDATCGLKAFRGDVGRDLFARARIYDWSFDAEILLLARRRHYQLSQVPVRWHDESGTKVNLARDVFKTLLGLFRIRWLDAKGAYAHMTPSDSATEVVEGGGAPTRQEDPVGVHTG